MTTKQQKIFNQVLDLNWEMKQEKKDFSRKLDLVKKLDEKKEELKNSIGEAEYNKLMNAGTKMFASKED